MGPGCCGKSNTSLLGDCYNSPYFCQNSYQLLQNLIISTLRAASWLFHWCTHNFFCAQRSVCQVCLTLRIVQHLFHAQPSGLSVFSGPNPQKVCVQHVLITETLEQCVLSRSFLNYDAFGLRWYSYYSVLPTRFWVLYMMVVHGAHLEMEGQPTPVRECFPGALRIHLEVRNEESCRF